MKIKVKKGRHYPSNMFKWKPIFYCRNKTITYFVKFTKDSFFQFEGDDIYDYSKLFGISFGHHQRNESYRYGFRMLNDETINTSLYYYQNGERKTEPIGNLEYGKKYEFIIKYNKRKNTVFFRIKDGKNVVYTSVKNIFNYKKWGYELGLYIGGNRPAPKKIEIEINKIR